MLLIVLVLVHFLPHLGSFPSSIWIRLPMTTSPWSVFHQLEWFILNLQSSSLPQPHWSFLGFFPPSMWPDPISVVNMYTFTAKMKETPVIVPKYGNIAQCACIYGTPGSGLCMCVWLCIGSVPLQFTTPCLWDGFIENDQIRTETLHPVRDI